MNNKKWQELVRKIRSSFKETPYPGDNNIGIGWPDGDEVEDAFKGKDWKDLSPELLFDHRDKLPFLQPEAFRFYLPAYLLAVLFHYGKMDTLIENLPFNLGAFTSESQPSKRLIENAKIMTSDQKAVIVEFLKNYSDIFPEGFVTEYISENVARGIRFWESQ